KIICAIIVAAGTLLLTLWWVVSPDVLGTASMGRNLFIFISLVTLAAAGIAGFIGGKLVFRD
ncbi:MAG: rubredoxin, partial [Deltaproteobacteria bacterium]